MRTQTREEQVIQLIAASGMLLCLFMLSLRVPRKKEMTLKAFASSSRSLHYTSPHTNPNSNPYSKKKTPLPHPLAHSTRLLCCTCECRSVRDTFVYASYFYLFIRRTVGRHWKIFKAKAWRIHPVHVYIRKPNNSSRGCQIIPYRYLIYGYLRITTRKTKSQNVLVKTSRENGTSD